ncbi:hypothetical protein SAY86_008451 [Trapa natans]|uniref:BAG domain-containing protein n=1 Tax=Trapa natans TaxID=22666 RepID=A0AAN7KDU6_TRANT|nr:hypothetical protein SAY86_008451 [Trapa natans]
MDSPFLRSRWNSHPLYYSPGERLKPAVPLVRNQTETVYPPTATVSRPTKVVSIPVRFVEPERDRSGLALKIQKVLRGFLVRKSVRRIAALRKEVEDIEGRVSDPEAVKLICDDPKERLRVSEMLMSVLFRLDSVRGVDLGVRDYRKTVIRRAIALQELIDEISAAGESQSFPEVDSVIDKCESKAEMRHVRYQEEDEVKLSAGDEIVTEKDGMVPTMSQYPGESTDNDKLESQTDSTNGRPQSLVEEDEENVMARDQSGADEKERDEVDCKSSRNEELMGKMVQDNQRMMGLMEELFERNERQTELLSALSQRVEQLERGLVCEMLRRKKKKRNGSGPQETRKCGGRHRC